MKIKVTVNTPKKQAAQCMKTQKKAYLGFKASKKVIKEELVNDAQFYWVLEIEPKDTKGLYKNAARGELMIRKFYRGLFKIIDRCNKIQKKTGKGAKWLKRQLIKRLKKQTEHSPDDDNELIKNIDNMSDDEFKDFIVVHDREPMEKLLSGDLIKLEELEDGELLREKSKADNES